MRYTISNLSKIIAVITIIIFASCGRNKLPDNYFKVGENVYELFSGYIINKGEASEGFNIDLRLYCEDKKDFINLSFVSEQAESLESTTHTDFDGSWVLGYNDDGSYTNMGNISSGNLIIKRDSKGYVIEFNGIDQYSNEVKSIFSAEKLNIVDEDNKVHVVPEYVLPNEIYDIVNQYFPIHSGINPPDIKGEYVSSPHIMIYESYGENPDSVQVYSDRYLGFLYNNNQLNFYGKQYDPEIDGDREEIQYGVKITGENDYFTCYYVVDGYPGGYYAQQSFLFSGKKSHEGLEEFFVAVILLETSGNPELEDKHSFRVLMDQDGLAEEENWLSKSNNSKRRAENDNEIFKMWMK